MNYTALKQRLIGPHVTLVTPWKGADQALDEAGLRSNARWVIEQGVVEGVGVLITGGSNGQAWAMTLDERKRAAEIVLDEARGKVPVLIGVNDTSPRASIELARFAERHGAAGVMATPPFYVPPTQREMLDFYRSLADAIDIGIQVYDISEIAKNTLEHDSYEELCQIEKVVSIKMGAPNVESMARHIARWGDRLAFTTNATFCIGVGYFLGATGFISGFGNFVPKMDIQLHQAATAGRWDEVRAIEKKRWALAECYHAFEERHGINAGMEMLYEATAMVGRVGGVGRPPLTPLTERDRTELKAALKLCGGL